MRHIQNDRLRNIPSDSNATRRVARDTSISRRVPVNTESVRSIPTESDLRQSVATATEVVRDVPTVPIDVDCIEPTICVPDIVIYPGQVKVYEFTYTSGYPFAKSFYPQIFGSEADFLSGENELTEGVPVLRFLPERPIQAYLGEKADPNIGHIRITAPAVMQSTKFFIQIWIVNACCAVPAYIFEKAAA